MDKLQKPLVAACKVVAAGSRTMLQPESQGGSFIEDVRSKRQKTNKWSVCTSVLAREAESTQAFGASG